MGIRSKYLFNIKYVKPLLYHNDIYDKGVNCVPPSGSSAVEFNAVFSWVWTLEWNFKIHYIDYISVV